MKNALTVAAAAASLVAGTFAAGGASAKDDVAPPPPPYTDLYQPQGTDEIGIWQLDDEREKALIASSVLLRDESLTGYARQILCDTVGEDRCGATRVYIIREPTFNATMSPNGTMRVFTGLLLRVRNEAELGAVLGHEFGHFENRHTLEQFLNHRRGTDLLAWSALLLSIAPSRQGYRSQRDLELSVYGGHYRFKRNQEREADLLGLGYLNRSAYRPQAAADVWVRLMSEREASARSLGKRRPDFERVAFFASHPPQAQRASYLAALAEPEGTLRDDGAERYRERLAPYLPLFLDDQIKVNDFGATEYIINSLAETGWTAELYYARAELFRQRGNQRDLVNAAESYRLAIAQDEDMAKAYRGLGLSLYRTGDRVAGADALRTFLELEPQAPDAAMIRMLVRREEVE